MKRKRDLLILYELYSNEFYTCVKCFILSKELGCSLIEVHEFIVGERK
jgi:hypothetical protein